MDDFGLTIYDLRFWILDLGFGIRVSHSPSRLWSLNRDESLSKPLVALAALVALFKWILRWRFEL